MSAVEVERRVMRAHMIEFTVPIGTANAEASMLRAVADWLDSHPLTSLLCLNLRDSVDGDQKVVEITVQGSDDKALDREVLEGIKAL